MNSIIEQMLSHYDTKNIEDEINALKEIIQEVVLSGLSRGGFFDEAAFYGGTALRIFYKLNRFSEDLDFALITPNKDFDLSKYFSFIEKEVKAYGLNLEISTKQKSADSNISSAFLITSSGRFANLATWIPYDLSIAPSLILCKNVILPSCSLASTWIFLIFEYVLSKSVNSW